MFAVGGEPTLVVDAQVHIWDASPHNQAIPDGEVYAKDLLRRRWELDGWERDGPTIPSYEAERVTEHSLNRDLFEAGYVDQAVLQPVVLGDLFVLGFSPVAWHAEMAAWMPGRFVLSGELDPGSGQPGARGLSPRVRRFGLRGLTLCERRPPAGRLSLADPGCAARWPAAGRPARGWCTSASGRRPARALAAVGGNRAAPRGRPPRVPRWAEPVGAGSALPVRTGAAPGCPRPGSTWASSGSWRGRCRSAVRARRGVPAGRAAVRARPAANVHVVLTEMLPWTGSRGFASRSASCWRRSGRSGCCSAVGTRWSGPDGWWRELAAYPFPAELRSGTRGSTSGPSRPCSVATRPGSTGSRRPGAWWRR